MKSCSFIFSLVVSLSTVPAVADDSSYTSFGFTGGNFTGITGVVGFGSGFHGGQFTFNSGTTVSTGGTVFQVNGAISGDVSMTSGFGEVGSRVVNPNGWANQSSGQTEAFVQHGTESYAIVDGVGNASSNAASFGFGQGWYRPAQ